MKTEIEFLLMLRNLIDNNKGLSETVYKLPNLKEFGLEGAVASSIMANKKGIQVINDRIEVLRLQELF